MNDKVGIYLRLSSDDGNDESESIANQRALTLEYINKNNLLFVKEYVDDGYTGTNFNRPGFKEMLSDIENNIVDVIVTKDLSRLGRNYVMVGEYIENFMPEHNVRYISILDNIDTSIDSVQNEIAPFRAVMNEMYSKDASNKVRSAKRNMMQNGKYASGSVPYGYKLDLDKNRFIIDEEAAKVIRKIYDLFLNGYRLIDIKRLLDSEKVPTPAMYMNMKRQSGMYDYWNVDSIKRILTSRVYVGDMIQHKTVNLSYKSKKKIDIPKDDYIVTPNAHEPIIREEFFTTVQSKFIRCDKNKRTYNHLLQDFLYCEHCGRKMSISVAKRKTKEDSYKVICPLNNKEPNLCYRRYIDYRELEKYILYNIEETLKLYLDKETLKDKFEVLIDKYDKEKNLREIKLKNVKEKIKYIERKIDTLYKDRLNNVISAENYKNFSFSLKEEKDILIKEENNLIKEINDINNRRKNDINDTKKLNKIIEDFFDVNNEKSSILKHLIDKIKIDKNSDITVFYKFNVIDFLCNNKPQ